MSTLNRRQFLKTIVVSAGTLTIGQSLVGCGSDNNDSVTPTPTPIVTNKAFFPQSIASGDPKPTSVILWTRVADVNRSGDLPIQLQVARDMAFNNMLVDTAFTALANHDGCIKVKIINLAPNTVYYYRFLYTKDNQRNASAVGRTKTAPALNDDVPVKFGFVSCQDYIGRYYNTYFKLIEEELDFVVHLGDYIYETTGDPRFQQAGSARTIRFTDQANAIPAGSGANQFFYAASLDNYRQLYKTYRADPLLQQVHEKAPMIVTWDDHEYSDDAWGATATISGGRNRNVDVSQTRKRNAEQAWFEYMPTDFDEVASGAIPFNAAQLYPTTRIYRDFRFGRHLHLLLTDYRTYRPDHLIPEDGFPGTVVVNRSQLNQVLAAQGIRFDSVANNLAYYFNIDDPQLAIYKSLLTRLMVQAYINEGLAVTEAERKATANIQGNLDVLVVNALLTAYNAAVPAAQQLPLFSDQQIATMERGISYAALGKGSFFGEYGSRYLVIKPVYDLFAAFKYLFDGGTASQNAYGTAQEEWLKTRLQSSTATWKIVASSVSNSSLQFDFSGAIPGIPTDILNRLPASLRNRFYLNVDHWDGFPNKRQELINFMDSIPNTLLIAGDIHSSYVSRHGQRTFEFTGTSVSSTTFGKFLADAAADLALTSIEPLLGAANLLLLAANPMLQFADLVTNGVVVMQVSAQETRVTYHLLPEQLVFTSYYNNRAALNNQFIRFDFRVSNGQLTTIR